ncbi:MAG: hypothetical protein JWM58_178 [Rhizobium sp.]|nr:hypothetical protein [Rhizobium sp.]
MLIEGVKSMYAGRYLWWNAIATMAYVFFAIYFYYMTWLAIRVSGCAAVIGNCGTLDTTLNAVIRPYGMLACGIVVLATGVMRIRFLRMSPLWGLALFIWFGASADFFFNLGDLWFARIDLETIVRGMPIETLFLAALVAFMCFPVELYKKSPSEVLRLVYYVAGFTASYSFSFTVANSPISVAYVRLITGSDQAVALFVAFQNRLRDILSLGQDGWLPIVIAFAIFLASLSYLVAMRKAPGGAPAAAAA